MKLIIFGFAVISAILMGCTLDDLPSSQPKYIGATGTPTAIPDGINRCDGIVDVTEKSSCLLEIAKFREDSSVCAKIPISATADECFEYIAQKRMEEGFCNEIKSDIKYRCYHDLALRKGDISICERIESNEIKNQCKAEITKVSPDLCPAYKTTDEQDECYFAYATMNGKKEACASIKGKEAAYRCLLTIAPNDINEALCMEMPDSDSKDRCLETVAINNLDVSICKKIYSWIFKYECLNVLALRTENVAVCENIDSPTRQAQCIDAVKKEMAK